MLVRLQILIRILLKSLERTDRFQTACLIRGPRKGGRCSEGLKFKSLELNLAWKVYVFDLIARIRRAVCNSVTR